MAKKEIKMYDGRVFGYPVSNYGKENGYLDYLTLSKMLGACILNNTIRPETMMDWDIVSGEFKDMIYQDYIISEYGYEILSEFTDEIVLYNHKLDIYIWGVTHFGTAWDHVLTDVKLKGD